MRDWSSDVCASDLLGESEKARHVFNRLASFGRKHMDASIRIDYFAVSLPDLLVFDQDLDLKNRIHCHYMIGLGYLGLQDNAAAGKELETTLVMNPYHQGTAVHLEMIAFLIKFKYDKR